MKVRETRLLITIHNFEFCHFFPYERKMKRGKAYLIANVIP